MPYDDHVKNQSNEEWLADFDRASGIKPEPFRETPSWRDKKIDGSKHLFRYVDHRTFTANRGTSVSLEFESLDHSLKAIRFFNVSLTSARGKRYPAGHRGQFNPPPRGKFRQFWLQSIGKAPTRWCRTHKQMRSSLSGLVFVGKIKHEQDSKGRPYVKLIEVRKHE